MADLYIEIRFEFAREIDRFDQEGARDIAAAIDRETFSAPTWIGGSKDDVVVKFGHFPSMDNEMIESTREVIETEFGQDVESWRVSAKKTPDAATVDFSSPGRV